jgi:transcriptional regulator with XRE-family HTH domain
MKEADPRLSQHEIARRLNLNPGRVSEVLRGKRS